MDYSTSYRHRQTEIRPLLTMEGQMADVDRTVSPHAQSVMCLPGEDRVISHGGAREVVLKRLAHLSYVPDPTVADEPSEVTSRSRDCRRVLRAAH